MTVKRSCWVFAMLAGLVGAFGFVGCSGSKPGGNVTRDPVQLATLTSCYTTYMRSHGGKAPPDEATFKKFVKEVLAKGTDLPPGAKPVSDIESLFVSEGDGKPFVILYGPKALRGPQEGPGGMPVVIYEEEGVGGRRFVASPAGAVDEVGQERFEQLVPKGGSSQ